jgi:MFS family permease
VSVIAEFRTLDRRAWYLAVARLVVSAGFSMTLPFLAMYLAVERQQPAVMVGIIWTTAGICGAAMQWVAGALSDRIGRRPVMMASMLLRAVNLAALGYATAVNAWVPFIGALIVCNAILRAFFDPVASALVADVTPPERRVAAFALQRMGVNIGWAVGPAATGLASYSTLFYVAAALTLLATVAIARIAEPPRSTTARPPEWREMFAMLDDRRLVAFLVATIAFFILQVQAYQAMPIYAARVLKMTLPEVGTLFSLNGLMVVFLQLPAVGFIRRVGTERALLIGCLAYAAGYASVGLAVNYPALLLSMAAITLAEIVSAPAQQAAITTLAPPGRIGIYAGLFGLCQVTGQSAGPLIGTALLDGLPSRVAWFALGLFGVAAATIYRRAKPKTVVGERVGPQ